MELSIEELYYQVAALPLYACALKQAGWPSVEAQRRIVKGLQPCNQPFLVSEQWRTKCDEFAPPTSYQRAIFRYLEKSIEDPEFRDASNNEDSEKYDDEFMEYCVTVINSYSNKRNSSEIKSSSSSSKSMLFSEDIEADQIGYASYPLPFYHTGLPSESSSQSISHNKEYLPRIPILIKKTFHQVGTKVWGAGLFLAELFQYMAVNSTNQQISKASNKSSNTSVWSDKVLFELGAGVGITGILVGRGLPLQLQPRRIIMTDCFDEVLKLLEYNISLLERTSDEFQVCDLIAEYCDWGNESSILQEQFLRYNPDCIFAADCTYSEDLNLLLISLFELYLHDCNSDEAVHACGIVEKAKESDMFLPLLLLEHKVKFVLIACTIRHPDTFNHFQEHLKSKTSLLVVDVSAEAHKMIETPLYLYDFRSNIRLFCITKNS